MSKIRVLYENSIYMYYSCSVLFLSQKGDHTVVYMSEEIETLLGVWAVSLSVSSDMYGARRRRRFFDAHAFLQRAALEDVLVPLALVHSIS